MSVPLRRPNAEPAGPPLRLVQGGAAPKSVVQVTWSLIAGGSEMFAFTLASSLDSARFRSVMCGVTKGGALEPEITRAGIPYYVLNRRGLDPRMPVKLLRIFRQHRAAVVHTHHFTQLLYAALPARLVGARLIHTEHSVEEFERPRIRKLMRLLSRRCYRVLAVGEEVARVLRDEVGIAAEKLEVIHAGVDVDRFRLPRDECRAALGLKDDEVVATIVARLCAEKNHALLLEAFAQAVREVPRATLLVAGDGPEEEAIRAKIAALGLNERVRLLGVRRDVPRILAASDCFVLSSDREGLPIAILEAMAAGLPIAATDVGDVSAVVRDGETGLLAKPGDAGSLGSALSRLLADASLRSNLGSAGRSLVEQNYSLRRMIDRHQALYDARD